MARRPALQGTTGAPSKPAPRKTRPLPRGTNDGADVPDAPIEEPERGPATPSGAVPERARVSVDTLVSRPDLGPTAATFVAAGDLIPLGLEGYEQTAA